MSDDDAMQGLCGAATRSGGFCKRPAGAGTDHLGYGFCKHHTGSTPNGNKHAAKEAGRQLAADMQLLAGTGVQIEPADALLACVRMAWAEVQFFNLQIQRLELQDAIVRPQREKTASLGEKIGGYEIEDLKLEERLNLWIVEKQRAMDRLAKYSKLALDAGIAERQVRIAEQLGSQLGAILQRIISALNLTPKQMELVPGIVRRELVALTTGG